MIRETASSESRLFYSVSTPQLTVERTELDRLADVVAGNVFSAGQVGDGARDFQDSVVGAGAQVQVRHRKLQQILRRVVQFAELFQFTAAHSRVARHLWFACKPRMLPLPRGDDALADLRLCLAGLCAGHFAKLHLRHFDVHVNPVKQRPGNPAKIILDFARR